MDASDLSGNIGSHENLVIKKPRWRKKKKKKKKVGAFSSSLFFLLLSFFCFCFGAIIEILKWEKRKGKK